MKFIFDIHIFIKYHYHFEETAIYTTFATNL